MYYVPGTELSSADIDKEESTCSQEVHNLSEIAQKQLYIAWKNTTEDTKNTKEHFRVYVQWTYQLSIYRSAVPNLLFSACSLIKEIQGTIDIFIVLMIILVYKYVVSFYLLKSFIPFPFYSFLYRVLYSLSEMYS